MPSTVIRRFVYDEIGGQSVGRVHDRPPLRLFRRPARGRGSVPLAFSKGTYFNSRIRDHFPYPRSHSTSTRKRNLKPGRARMMHMIPMRTSSVFKSRWMALIWAAGIIWFAYDFAGSGRSRPTTNASSHRRDGAPVTAERSARTPFRPPSSRSARCASGAAAAVEPGTSLTRRRMTSAGRRKSSPARSLP